MQPRLFRRRLLELAGEYESLHAAAGAVARGGTGCSGARGGTGRSGSSDRAAVLWRPTPPAEVAPEGPAAAGRPPDGWRSTPPAGTPGGPAAAADWPLEPWRPSLPPSAREQQPREREPAAEGGAPAGPCGDGEEPPAPDPTAQPRALSATPSVQWEDMVQTPTMPSFRSEDRPPTLTLPAQHKRRTHFASGADGAASPSGRALGSRPNAGRRARLGSAASSIVSHLAIWRSRSSGMVSSHSGASGLSFWDYSSNHGRSQFEAAVRKTRDYIRNSDSLQTRDARPLTWLVKSRSFAVTIACLVILSILLIGIETEVLASMSDQGSGSEQALIVLSAANYALTFLFTLEMAARIYVFRLDFFGEERVWNCFDMIILVLALAEVALELAVHSLSGGRPNPLDSGGTAKMLRLFRLARLLRLVRTLRQLKPLRSLVQSLVFAGRSVFWALMLLLMIVYAFGVVLTQAVTEHTEGGTRIEDEALVSHFGNLYRSMMSLWMAVSGGISWIELSTPLEKTENWRELHILFLFYIIFVYFFILNVVTGVFCQSAFEGAQQDLELSIEAQLREKQLYVDRLGLLFREMNDDPNAASDGLTAAELHYQLEEPKVQSWFRALDIDAKHAWKLFKILDHDNTGHVSFEEFVEGCLRLRGQASRVDVESLKWEIRGANARAERRAQSLSGLIEKLGSSSSTPGATPSPQEAAQGAVPRASLPSPAENRETMCV